MGAERETRGAEREEGGVGFEMMDRIAWIEGIVSRLERPALVALLGMEFWVQERSDDLHASFAGEPARSSNNPGCSR